MNSYDALCARLTTNAISDGSERFEAAAMIATLVEERDSAFVAGMQKAAEVCRKEDADYANDLILTAIEEME